MVDIIKGLISPPVDGSTQQEVKELIKVILTTFTVKYVKHYAIGLVKKHIDDASADPDPEWKLLERPPRDQPFMSGYVMKEAGFFGKSMKKRFFVVRPDYMIEYYASEEEANKGGKKRGTISLCGYSVNDDANNGPLQRLMKLAEKMGIDTSSLPKPKQYPPNTMELYHGRRQTYYINVGSEEEFKKWVEQMRSCAWRAYGLKNQDEIHKHAFHKAVRATRWKLGRWGYWSYGGTEEEILSDIISDQLDYAIMGRIYSKIVGPWQVRNTLRNQVLKIFDKLTLAAVTPAWKAMESAVNEIRKKIEPKVAELADPVGKAQLEIITKIKDGAMSIIDPILKDKVAPHLRKVVECIQSPMTDAFDESYRLFDAEFVGKFEPKATAEENKVAFRDLDYYPYSWKMWDVTRKVDVMYDPLWALNVVFSDIYPWSSIWTAHDLVRKTMDNAIYTYQVRLLEAMEKGEKDTRSLSDRLRAEVLADYRSDANQARVFYYRDIIKKIVMPPFSSLVYPPCEAILEPITSLIPEPLADVIDINNMFERVVEGIIDDSIATVLSDVK